MPGAPPPSFYDNVAAMGGPGGPGGAGAKPPMPMGGAGNAQDAEVLEAFKAIFKAMAKMEKAKPELRERFAPVNQQLKAIVSDVMKVNPESVAAGAEAPPPGPGGDNKSPQDAAAAPMDNKSPQDVPVPA